MPASSPALSSALSVLQQHIGAPNADTAGSDPALAQQLMGAAAKVAASRPPSSTTTTTPNPAMERLPLQIGPWNTGLNMPVWASELAAGAGQKLTDAGLAAKQIGARALADVDPRFQKLPTELAQEAAQKRALDAPLLRTWGGWLGSNGAAFAPFLIPGAGELGAMTALSGAEGALTPTAPGESRLLNTGLGAGLGALGKVGGDAIGGVLSKVGAKYLKPALTDAQQAALEGGETLGMRVTPGERLGSTPLRQVESWAQSHPWISGPFSRLTRGNQAALDRTAAASISENADTVDATVMGRAADRLGDIFERVRNAERPADVDPTATQSFLDQLDEQHEGLLPGDMPIRSNRLVGQLDGLMQRAKGVEPNRDAFLADFEKLSTPNPNEPATRLVNGNVSVDLVRDPLDPNTVHLEGITALTKREGAGSAALRRLTDLADKHGVRLTLDAQSMDAQGLPQNALEQWYAKNGFRTIASENGWMPLMERTPTAGKVTAKQLGQLSSKLGKGAYKQMTTESGDRDLGQALYQVKDHVDDLLENSLTGAEREEYAAARGQYRNLMNLARRGVVNPSTGHVSGGALANRLQAVDRPGFLYGKNTSPLYRAARFAQAFKPIVGDSGTATRSANPFDPLELAMGLPANLASRFYLSPVGQAAVGDVAPVIGAAGRGAAFGVRRGAAPAARYLLPRLGATAVPWIRGGAPLPWVASR